MAQETDVEIEEERQRALADLDKDASANFAPGTMGAHEALHMAYVISSTGIFLRIPRSFSIRTGTGVHPAPPENSRPSIRTLARFTSGTRRLESASLGRRTYLDLRPVDGATRDQDLGPRAHAHLPRSTHAICMGPEPGRRVTRSGPISLAGV
jgi:hypothetical protein